MRSAIKLFITASACMLLLSGCTQSRQVENQAYVIALGVDSGETGGIALTAKIPALSSSSSEGKPSGGDAYKVFSASGENYNLALKNLHVSSPRNLNLSHLELLAISEELARDEEFPSLVEDIAQTERLYTASYTVITRGRASAYVEALEAAVGSRLSLDIPARFENYSEQGITAESKLADVFYLTESFYSDPIVTIVAPTEDSKNTEASSKPYTKTRPDGTAVLKDGRMTLELDENESVLANLLRNEVKYFRYEVGSDCIEAAPASPCRIKVDCSETPIRIQIKLALNIGTQEDMPNEETIKRTIERDVFDLIHKAQQHGAEPFGFAKVAARSFPTIQKWMQFDWENAYKNADISVNVSLSRWDA